jgi:hypothetical protein
MGLELQVDAGGCHGRVIQDEPGRLPSNGTMVRWFLTLACPTALLLGTRAPRQAFPVLAGLLVVTVIAHAIRGEGGWFDWEWELNSVARRFEVANGILTVRGPDGVYTAPLAQARVTRFEDGVQVNPALGAPVQLTWSGATAHDVARLATLLETASAHRLDERGTRRDVPDDLEGLR